MSDNEITKSEAISNSLDHTFKDSYNKLLKCVFELEVISNVEITHLDSKGIAIRAVSNFLLKKVKHVLNLFNAAVNDTESIGKKEKDGLN